MKRATVLVIFIGAALAVTSYSTLRAQQAAASSVADGIYTEQQAKRGETVYADTCAACHGATLAGGSGPGTPLVGMDFIVLWRTVGELFEKIKLGMPADRPGTLTPRQAADVVAFVLSANNYPVGMIELGTDPAPMRLLRMVEPPSTPSTPTSAPTR